MDTDERGHYGRRDGSYEEEETRRKSNDCGILVETFPDNIVGLNENSIVDDPIDDIPDNKLSLEDDIPLQDEVPREGVQGKNTTVIVRPPTDENEEYRRLTSTKRKRNNPSQVNYLEPSKKRQVLNKDPTIPVPLTKPTALYQMPGGDYMPVQLSYQPPQILTVKPIAVAYQHCPGGSENGHRERAINKLLVENDKIIKEFRRLQDTTIDYCLSNDLITRFRSNIIDLLSLINSMEGIMKNMPPIPVKLNSIVIVENPIQNTTTKPK